MSNVLVPGQVRVGHLVDGLADTPYQAATLTYDQTGGVQLAIPYVHGASQFNHVAAWFKKNELPPALLFEDNLGTVTLTGLRYAGQSGLGAELGTARCDVTLLGRPRRLKDEYRVRGLSSTIDGLQELARFTPIEGEYETTDTGRRYVVKVNTDEQISWRRGGFSYTIRSSVPWTQTGREAFEARPEPFIKTSTYAGANADAHIDAQWPLRALFILMHGAPLHWRRHWIEDPQFPAWSIGGDDLGATATDAILRRTVRDTQDELPDRGDLTLPAFRLADLGPRGLRKWCALYDDESLRRAVEPAVEVVNGISKFLEAQVMMIALALDAMGYYRDENRVRNTPMWKQIVRCINVSGADWSAIGSEVGIAKLISETNNAIKHPDKKFRPDAVQLSLVADLGVLLARLQLFDLLDVPMKVRDAFLRSRDWNFLVAAFEMNGRYVADDGSLVPRTEK